MGRAWIAVWGLAGALVGGCGGGPSRVSFVSNERPTGYAGNNAQGTPSGPAGSVELADDDRIEPSKPAADTKQERALVHIHGPNEIVCSGVVLDSKVVATAQRCLRGQPKGATELGAGHEYRVEVASSTLTWTNRRARYAVVPACEEDELDVALLVLDEPAPPLVVPLKIASAPNTGARVDALGFGHCAGSATAMKDRSGAVRSRDGQSLVVDIPLCRGDVGGPVIDGRDGEVVGLISRRDSPRGSPLKTTKIVRLDTTVARDLLEQAREVAGGKADVTAIACQ